MGIASWSGVLVRDTHSKEGVEVLGKGHNPIYLRQ
jgi:hypothetical protein